MTATISPDSQNKLTPFLSRCSVLVTPNLFRQFTNINKALDRCCDLAPKKTLLNEQKALMTDASFTAAGYPVLIEDDPLQTYTSTREALALVANGSIQTFSPTQLKMSINVKDCLAKFLIILTDKKSGTQFFKHKPYHLHSGKPVTTSCKLIAP